MGVHPRGCNQISGVKNTGKWWEKSKNCGYKQMGGFSLISNGCGQVSNCVVF